METPKIGKIAKFPGGSGKVVSYCEVGDRIQLVLDEVKLATGIPKSTGTQPFEFPKQIVEFV